MSPDVSPDVAELVLREQFSTPEQQKETVTFGMWVFIASEMMLFGILFVAFTVYNMYYRQAFAVGSADMEILLGSINTAVLICSSFTMALAVYCAEIGRDRLIIIFLIATMILGVVFIGIKFTEYYKHFLDHKAPAVWFEESGPNAGKVQLFFIFYFIMTGLHALHMTAGIGLLAITAVRTAAGRVSSLYRTPIEIAGLYWHFIDIIWVFLYAIFYLPGLHK